jgi:hypothetical protein
MPRGQNLASLIEQKRMELARLKDDLEALERVQAMLQARQGSSRALANRLAFGSYLASKRASTRDLILDRLRASRSPLSPGKLREQLAALGYVKSPNLIRFMVTSLAKQGLIRRVRRGYYTLPSSLASPSPVVTAAQATTHPELARTTRATSASSALTRKSAPRKPRR